MSVAERVAAIVKECAGVWGQSGITQWERDRLDEWRRLPMLSPAQDRILQQIEQKAFGNAD